MTYLRAYPDNLQLQVQPPKKKNSEKAQEINILKPKHAILLCIWGYKY